MNFIGNIIWFIFGGFIIAIEYFIASIILMLTIIGIPFAFQTLKLASLAIWPFGRQAINIDQASGCLSTILNIVWLLFGGIWIALSHIIFGLLFTITIIGIPFGAQHFKMASLALLPFGKTIKW